MFLPFFIARRYIFSRHSLSFITIITSISILGIAIGVAALVAVTSIFNGFRSLVETVLIEFDPHVRVSAADGAWLQKADSLLSVIKEVDGVVAASPIVAGKIVGTVEGSVQAFLLRGVEPGEIESVSGIRDAVVSGAFDLRDDEKVHLILGIGLADKMRSFTGDSLSLLSPLAIEKSIAFSAMPPMAEAGVSGVFQLNNREYDAFHAYTHAAAARRLFNAPPGAASHIDIRCEHVEDADALAARLRTLLADNGKGVIVETWYDLHKDLYNVLRFERMASFTILTLIILIAVFNVFASLTMTVSEKRSEIGALKAMGATSRLILRIFFTESVVIGSLGTFIGLVLGLLLCYGQIEYGWFALDTSKYIVPAIPVLVQAQDVLLITVVALGLSLLAGWYPARKAARVRMARVLMLERGLS